MTGLPMLAARLCLGVYWIALAIGSHWPHLNIAGKLGVRNDDFAFGLDKWVHVGAYAGLMWLVLQTQLLRRTGRLVLWSAVLVLAYAGVDEWAQRFSGGRTVQFADWVASAIGVPLGLAGWTLTNWLSRHDGSFAAHGRLVSALTLVSRVFGLLRDWALWFVFGLTGVMDAFIVAFLIPNLFRRLFGEGALAASFVPHYTSLQNRDPASAAALVSRVLRWLFLVVGGIVAIAVVALLATRGAAELTERSDLTVKLTTITLWYAPLVCAAAIAGAALQVHGRFGPPAAAPIILNLVLIGSALSLGPSRVAWVAAAVVAAGVLQLVWHLVLLPERQSAAAIDPSAVKQTHRDILKQWAPTVLGLAVFQLNVLADVLIAMFFSATEPGQTFNLFGSERALPMSEGDVGALAFAQRLYEFPLGVFGIAIATAIFPALAKMAHDRGGFAALMRQGLRLTVFIGLPASVGLFLVREPISRVIFFRADSDDAVRIAAILAGYAPAVWAYSMNQVLTRGFYAQKNPMTPVRIGMAMVGLNLVLNLTLIWPLGAAGLAWSTALCACLQSALLIRAMRRHADHPVDGSVWGSWARTLGLSAVMGAAVWGLSQTMDLDAGGRWQTLGLLAALCGTGATVFFVGARLLRYAELGWILKGSGPADEVGEDQSSSD